MSKKKKDEIEQTAEKTAASDEVKEQPVEQISAESQPDQIVDRTKGQWYILQTYSGHEKKVRESLMQKIIRMSLQDQIYEVLIPEEETIEIKDNKRVEKIKKMFPGYVFIRMEMDENLWYHVKAIPGASKFISSKTKPTAVTDNEMLRVLKQVGVKTPKIEVDFELGEVVKIISGPFRGYSGPIQEISAERGKIKASIEIFGRETPVELEFEQVEKQR